MAPEKPGFLEELKRRHVWRIAVAYVVAAWVLVQVATQVFPFFNVPNWFVRVVVILLAIGFPVAVAFAWIYEVTPEGIRRTAPADSPDARPEHAARDIGRKLNAVIMIVLVLAVALMAWRLLALRHDSPGAGSQAVAAATSAPPATSNLTVAAAAPKATPAAFNPAKDTLVVLPFTNLNGDPKQQYFSDGITEELTNALGQNTALTVIAWDTASKYRNSHVSPAAIGAALDVATLLHGSIEREGGMIRVLAELVDTRTGKQLWSDHYDDSLANIFAVQDQISAAIAGALKVKFASLGAAPTVNPKAHDLVLQARALMDAAHTAAPIEQGRTLLEQAVALAPDYADAHAQLARAWFALTEFSTLPLKQALPKVREEAHAALALDPRNVDALVALANADRAEVHIARAQAEYQRALAIDPSDANGHMEYGTVLPLKQGLAQELEAVQLDPGNATAQNNLATIEQDLGEYAQALAPWLATIKLDPHSADSAFELALTYALLRRDADAVKAFDLAQPVTPLAKALVAAGRLSFQAVLDPKLHAKALAAVDALRRRPDLDPFSKFDVIQLELALGEKARALALLPQSCAAASVACNDLGINPLWLPLHGEPRFEALVKQYDTISKPAAAASTVPAAGQP